MTRDRLTSGTPIELRKRKSFCRKEPVPPLDGGDTKCFKSGTKILKGQGKKRGALAHRGFPADLGPRGNPTPKFMY